MKYGDTRADGYRFRGLERRGAKTYEKWVSPEEWEHRKRYRKASYDRRGQVPEVRAARVAATIRSYHKRKRENPALVLWQRAKRRAKERGLEFTIDVADVVVPAICPVLGLRLEMASGQATDCSPELDRTDNLRGYVPGNVAVISRRANRIKNNAATDELAALVTYLTNLQAASETS